MQNTDLSDVRIAVLVSDGFEQEDFDLPVQELKRCGATVEVLALSKQQMQVGIESMQGLKPTEKIMPDLLIHDADPARYQALMIPGGVLSVDRLREQSYPIAFVQSMSEARKPIGAMGHGPWLLADAGVSRGITLTSWPTIRRDLERAGAIWKEAPTVEDEGILTCRGTPPDLERFTQSFLDLLERKCGRHRSSAA